MAARDLFREAGITPAPTQQPDVGINITFSNGDESIDPVNTEEAAAAPAPAAAPTPAAPAATSASAPRDLYAIAGIRAGDRLPVPPMTAGSVARDAASDVLQIGPEAVKGVSELAQLATGNAVGSGVTNAMNAGEQAIRDVVGSARDKAQQENLQRDLAGGEASLTDLLKYDKGAIASNLLPTIGSFVVPAGAVGAVGKLAGASKAISALSDADRIARLTRIQQAAGIGAAAAQAAASTFNDELNKGASLEDAYKAAGITVPFSLVFGALGGGGVATKAGQAFGGTAARAGIGAALKTGAQQGLMSGGMAAGQSVASDVGDHQPISVSRAVKQGAVGAAAGFLTGTGLHFALPREGAAQPSTGAKDATEQFDRDNPSPPGSGTTPPMDAFAAGAFKPGEGVNYDDYVRYVGDLETGGQANPDTAKAGTSSATGRFQFTAPTWLNIVKAGRAKGGFGWAKGMSDAEIEAQRTNGARQDEVMQAFSVANAKTLADNNLPITNENLYALHFMGPKDGLAFINADPKTPMKFIMSARAVLANDRLSEMTKAQVLADWAKRTSTTPEPTRGPNFDFAQRGAQGERPEDVQPAPEPTADLNAQADAVRNPESAKTAMMVTPGESTDGVDTSGMSGTATNAGLLLTNDADKAAAARANGGNLDDATVAGLLGYGDTKDASDGTVVQARDTNGAIVHQEATTQQQAPAARVRAIAAAPGATVETTTAADALADRAARSAVPPFDPRAVQARTFPQFGREAGLTATQMHQGAPERAALLAQWQQVLAARGERPQPEPIAPAQMGFEAPAAASDEHQQMQPRDRATQQSVIQMQSIARNPNFLLLKQSNSPETGAPMAFANGDVTNHVLALGNEDVAVMSDGQEVPFRYALVDASQLQPSNFADGSVNPEYDKGTPGALVALNNGRSAALRAAYQQGTAGSYRARFAAAAPSMGIPQADVERAQAPVLIRLYSQKDNRSGMGMRSQGQTLGMTASETAASDASLMDSDLIHDLQDAPVETQTNAPFVRGFVQRLQQAGQDVSAFLDKDGHLSQGGIRRLQAALMQRAYGDNALVSAMFESTDEEMRAIGSALRGVSGKWLAMRAAAADGTINPEVDITGNLLEALRMVQKSRRESVSLYDLAGQRNLDGSEVSPITIGVLRLLYDGQYLTRAFGATRVEAFLRAYTEAASATTSGSDLLGEHIGPVGILNTIAHTDINDAAIQARRKAREAEPRASGAVLSAGAPPGNEPGGGGGAGEGTGGSGAANAQPSAGSDQHEAPAASRGGEGAEGAAAGRQDVQQDRAAVASTAAVPPEAARSKASSDHWRALSASARVDALVAAGIDRKRAENFAKRAAWSRLLPAVRQALADEWNGTKHAEPGKARAMQPTEEGRPADGKPLMPGDTFRTASGGETTPFPAAKSELAADRWLAENAEAEAARRSDDFNGPQFARMAEGLAGKRKADRHPLSPSDRDSLNLYLWHKQPAVVPRITHPLVEHKAMRAGTERDAHWWDTLTDAERRGVMTRAGIGAEAASVLATRAHWGRLGLNTRATILDYLDQQKRAKASGTRQESAPRSELPAHEQAAIEKTAAALKRAEPQRQKEEAERDALLRQHQAERAANPPPEAQWVKTDGADVLRIEGSDYYAVPVSGRKSSARFDMRKIDTTMPSGSSYVTQLKRTEVKPWLARMAASEAEDRSKAASPTAEAQGKRVPVGRGAGELDPGDLPVNALVVDGDGNQYWVRNGRHHSVTGTPFTPGRRPDSSRVTAVTFNLRPNDTLEPGERRGPLFYEGKRMEFGTWEPVADHVPAEPTKRQSAAPAQATPAPEHDAARAALAATDDARVAPGATAVPADVKADEQAQATQDADAARAAGNDALAERMEAQAQDLLGAAPSAGKQAAADEIARRADAERAQQNAAPGPEGFELGMVDARNGKEIDPNQRELLMEPEAPYGTDDEAFVRALVNQYASDPDAPSEARIRDAVQQFRDTERQLGGRDAYRGARDDGRTRLGYSQWVQVRTPNFKKWWGYDWEDQNSTHALVGRPGPDARSGVAGAGRTDAGVDQRRDDVAGALEVSPRAPERGVASGGQGARGLGQTRDVENRSGDQRSTDAAVDRRREDVGGGAEVPSRQSRDVPFYDLSTGEPRVFFHGTRDDFTAFDVNHPNKKDAGWLGRGHYVSSDPAVAWDYASMKRGTGQPRVMALFVRPNNPRLLLPEDKLRIRRLSPEQLQRFSADARASGHDGALTVYGDGAIEIAVFDANGLKSAIGNIGTFDSGSDNMLHEPVASYGAIPGSRNLVALHNLSAEDIVAADKLGGMPVPSVAVTKIGLPHTGFGKITLIGSRGLVDEKSGTPVFDRDAYSPTSPAPEWSKPSLRRFNEFMDRVRGAKALGDDWTEFRSEIGEHGYEAYAPSRDKLVGDFHHYTAPKLLFLRDVLHKSVRPIMRPARQNYAFIGESPELRSALKALGSPHSDEFTPAKQRAVLVLVKQAIRKLVDKHYPDEKAANDALYNMIVGGLRIDESGMSPIYWSRMIDDAKNFGTREVDEFKMRDRVNKLIGPHEKEYDQWINEKIGDLFPPPHITVRGRKVPMTLDNIVDAMTIGDVRGRENTVTFGDSKVNAMAGRRLRSVGEMHAEAKRLVGPDEFDASKKAREAPMREYRERLLPAYRYYRPGEMDTWSALDSANKAIADAVKNGGTPLAIQRAFRKNDFPRFTEGDVERAQAVIAALRNPPVRYFEAKPQRAVGLDEFRGAVVPKGTDPEALAVLRKHGLQIVEYGKAQDARSKTTAALARKLDRPAHDVLFRRVAAAAGATPRDDVQAVVDGVRAHWQNAPEIRVIGDMSEAPEDARTSNDAQLTGGASGEPQAFYHDGAVYLVASAIHSPQEARTAVLHEVVGHFGLRGAFGVDLDPILKQIIAARRQEVLGVARSYGLHQADNAAALDDGALWNAMTDRDRMTAAEEVLTHMAETQPKLGFVRRMVAAIRTWLRAHMPEFLKPALSDDEIVRNILTPAREFVEQQARANDEAKAASGPLPVSGEDANTYFKRIYHGTPAAGIEREGFKLNKIGSGEGAQAYGWGIYGAEARKVAEGYRKRLTDVTAPETFTWRGRQYDPLTSPEGHAIALAYHEGVDSARRVAQMGLRDVALGEPVAVERGAEYWQRMLDRANEIHSRAEIGVTQGHLYAFDVPDDAKLLDWDKPLSEQPEAVRSALSSVNGGGTFGDSLQPFENTTGQGIYRALAHDLGSPRAASEALRDAGIPGLRYLDGQSRHRPLRNIKRQFLAELPEDADFDDVIAQIGTGTFSPKNEAILKALADDGWLGFDYPAQALSAALSTRLRDFDPSPALLHAVADAQEDGTHNYVIWDAGLLTPQAAKIERIMERRRAYQDERQLELFQSDPDTAGQDAARAAPARRDALSAVADLRSAGTLLDRRFVHDYAARQRVSLVGQQVLSPLDIATVAQVYRDPRFETFRLIFTKGDRVVSQLAVTSRLPASSRSFAGPSDAGYMARVAGVAKDAGADGYYMMHNHPSGDPTPSPADEETTQSLVPKLAGLRFHGHVVIDTNSYGLIDAHGRSERIKHDFGAVMPYTADGFVGKTLLNSTDAAEFAKRLAVDPGAVTIVAMNAKGVVTRVGSVPAAVANLPVRALRAVLRRAVLAGGGMRMVVVGRDLAVLQKVARFAEDGIHIDDNGVTHSLLGTKLPGGKLALLPRDRDARVAPATTPEFNYLKNAQGPYSSGKPGVREGMDDWLNRSATGQETPGGRPEAESNRRKANTDEPRTGNFVPPGGTVPPGAANRSGAMANVPIGWQTPEGNAYDSLVYHLQDKNVDLKRVTQAIEKSSGTLDDAINARLHETLYKGRAAAATKQFNNFELDPLIRRMQALGISMDDMQSFLRARHAEEANALVAKRNPNDPDMADGGSGMTNAEARAILSGLTPERRAALNEVAGMADKIIANTRKLMVGYHLIDQDTADHWAGMFKHYVPLNREIDGASPGSLTGTGSGFNVKGKESKSRTGSTRDNVTNVLANIALQREHIIARGEKNRVVSALYALAKANAAKDFWITDRPPTTRQLGSDGLVHSVTDFQYKSAPNVIIAKIPDGTGKIIERAIVFNKHDPRALRMAMALKNLDDPDMGAVMSAFAATTRYFASMSTQYNPVFGMVNLIRDVQEAMVNLSSTPLGGKQVAVAKEIMPALAGIMRAVHGVRDAKEVGGHYAEMWRRFEAAGGPTGFRELFNTTQDRANSIAHILDPDGWMKSRLGKIVTAGGTLRVPYSVARRSIAPLWHLLSDYNEAMENSTRLAAFIVAVRPKAQGGGGMSDAAGAALAKELTVNFDRKGRVSSQVGALYAFFNASVQGTARLGRTLFTMEPGKPKTLRLSKAGAVIVFGGMLLGAIDALLMQSAGYNKDDPPEWLRERNFIIPTGDGGYKMVPLSLGYQLFPNMGRLAVQYAMDKTPETMRYVSNLLGVAMDAFSPIASSGLSLTNVSPTAVAPISAIATNQDFTGRNVAREKQNPNEPGQNVARPNASKPAIWAATALNAMTGGDKYVAGMVSPSPDAIDYLVGQLTGGVGREALKGVKTTQALVDGTPLPSWDVPLLGRFYGDTKADASVMPQFYDNLDHAQRLRMEIQGLQKDGLTEQAAAAERRSPEWVMGFAGPSLQRTLTSERKAITAIQAQPALTPEAKKAQDDRVKQLNDVMLQQIKQFNAQYAEKAKGSPQRWAP